MIFKLSIKYKLLILLSFVSIVFLSIFLLITVNLFKTDKIAYIFDSSSSYTSSTANQIENQIKSYLDKINIILDGFDYQNNEFDNVSANLFNKYDKLISINIIKIKRTGHTKMANLTKKDYQDSINISKKQLSSINQQIQLNKFAFLINKKFENFFFIAFPFATTSKFKLIAVTLYNAPIFQKIIRSSKSFSTYLLDTNGKVVLEHNSYIDDKSDNNGNKISEIINSDFFKKLKVSRFPEGTAEIALSNDYEGLVSYTRLNLGNLLVIAEIDKKTAFKAIRDLLRKAGLFFSGLIFLSIVVSIISSNSVTSPLRKLSHTVEKISEGEFDLQVKIKSSDEIGQLADGVNSMSKKISVLLNELKEYSEHLEDMVSARTAQLKKANNFIKTMIDSLGQGLLVFNKEGNCLPVYTKICEEFFKTRPKDKHVSELLEVENGKLDSFKKWIMGIFQDLIPFQSMVELGPTSIVNRNNQFLSLEYQPFRDENDHLTGVVLVATDKTQEMEAKRKAEENEAYSKMIIKIVKNKEQFLSFVQETKNIINRLEQFVDVIESSFFKANLYCPFIKLCCLFIRCDN